jgi:hypothetical protein
MTFQFLSPKPSSHTHKIDADGDIDMLLKSERKNFEKQIVTPGQLITDDPQYMRFVYLPEFMSSSMWIELK